MKRVGLLIGIATILCTVHVIMLLKVSRREKVLKETIAHMEMLEKDVERKEMEYDTMLDLEKIGKEMTEKKGMTISQKINFFQINE
ncbi:MULTISPECIES: hypothetical protein [Fusobacterium]|uniref:Uncharacterized protein n=1 Tax=Fusobacterium hominis TaxID=2764326 RepID=A0A7G9GXR9_9FUSO|nr:MULTISPECIES: hypothetical protein [Fusobacterium]QNM15601.1 hypothetical protein H9Q81_01800 [Fusobacterium hominis]